MAVKNTIVSSKDKEDKKGSLKAFVDQMIRGGAIAKALPSVMTPERFARITVSAISNSEDLQNCDGKSFVAAMMQAAQLGLEPNTPLGQAYLIPYAGHCQFQIGYQGLLDLAWRTRQYKRITAETVYENDKFDYELGLDPYLKHKPATGERGRPIAFYATYTLENGGQGFTVMTVTEINDFRKKFSKATNSPWNSNFEAMAKKTVLKQVLKYAPKSADMAKAISADATVKSGLDADMSTVAADNVDVFDAEVSEAQPAVDATTGEVIPQATEPSKKTGPQTAGKQPQSEDAESLI